MILNKPSGIAVQSGTKSPKNIIDILNKFSEEKKYLFSSSELTKKLLAFSYLHAIEFLHKLYLINLEIKLLKKSYLAILHGSIPHNEGTLDHNLSIKEKSR